MIGYAGFPTSTSPGPRRRWSRRYLTSFSHHKPTPFSATAAIVNQAGPMTRQQKRFELRAFAMDFMRERYSGELRATRRRLGLARARGGWRMTRLQKRLSAVQNGAPGPR